MDRRVAADGTLIRRALAPTGAGIEAAVAAASVPPLSGGPGGHGSGAAHAFTIAERHQPGGHGSALGGMVGDRVAQIGILVGVEQEV